MKPHGKALRKGRFSQQGGIYLLSFTAYLRHPWFTDWVSGRLVVAALRRSQELGGVESLAYVVMPDHVHWLVGLGHARLDELMRNVKSHSGFHVKQRIKQKGGAVPKAVWQAGYHDRALRREESLREVAHYIVLNPVRAGLVKSIRDYPLWDAIWL